MLSSEQSGRAQAPLPRLGRDQSCPRGSLCIALICNSVSEFSLKKSYSTFQLATLTDSIHLLKVRQGDLNILKPELGNHILDNTSVLRLCRCVTGQILGTVNTFRLTTCGKFYLNQYFCISSLSYNPFLLLWHILHSLFSLNRILFSKHSLNETFTMSCPEVDLPGRNLSDNNANVILQYHYWINSL